MLFITTGSAWPAENDKAKDAAAIGKVTITGKGAMNRAQILWYPGMTLTSAIRDDGGVDDWGPKEVFIIRAGIRIPVPLKAAFKEIKRSKDQRSKIMIGDIIEIPGY